MIFRTLYIHFRNAFIVNFIVQSPNFAKCNVINIWNFAKYNVINLWSGSGRAGGLSNR